MQSPLEEALALSRALGVSLDHLARPAGLTRAAGELLDAAREARDSNRQAEEWAGQSVQARSRLMRAIERNAGHEHELSDEFANARRALDETSH